MGYSDKCGRRVVLTCRHYIKFPQVITFILKWDQGYHPITTNYSMYILDKIFIHVNNEIYTGVINLCVGDRRSRYNNCYRLSFSDNNKLAIKKCVTMSLCCQRAQSSHGKMFHTILLSTCDGETVYSNQAKTPQYNSNSMKKHVYQDFQRRKLNISFSK